MDAEKALKESNSTNLFEKTNKALAAWRQGDVAFPSLDFAHWADLSRPITDASSGYSDEGDTPAIVFSEAIGVVVLSQTCDVVRESKNRPYIEVAPLISVDNDLLERVKAAKQPQFAYVPSMASKNLVADLDRTMTVEKTLVANWDRIPGWQTDEEIRNFAQALARKRARFAFPNDFASQSSKMQNHLKSKHGKNHEEGACLEGLREIRVRAAPSWDGDKISLTFWFITDEIGANYFVELPKLIEKWTGLFEVGGRFSVEAGIAIDLADMTAKDYTESDRLDFDYLSQP